MMMMMMMLMMASNVKSLQRQLAAPLLFTRSSIN
jgi:hypothetical protein